VIVIAFCPMDLKRNHSETNLLQGVLTTNLFANTSLPSRLHEFNYLNPLPALVVRSKGRPFLQGTTRMRSDLHRPYYVRGDLIRMTLKIILRVPSAAAVLWTYYCQNNRRNHRSRMTTPKTIPTGAHFLIKACRFKSFAFVAYTRDSEDSLLDIWLT